MLQNARMFREGATVDEAGALNISNQIAESIKEVAAMMGISRSYVSRIEKKALEKLRNSYEEYM